MRYGQQGRGVCHHTGKHQGIQGRACRKTKGKNGERIALIIILYGISKIKVVRCAGLQGFRQVYDYAFSFGTERASFPAEERAGCCRLVRAVYVLSNCNSTFYLSAYVYLIYVRYGCQQHRRYGVFITS